MKINRSNYEIWFIDWADNNLDEARMEELKLFLQQNPDLYEEFNELSRMKLASSNPEMADKSKLKKSPESLSPDQFDYMCVAYFEGDLTEGQQAEFIEIKESKPENIKSFELLSNARLKSPAYTFKGKKSLHRKTVFQKAAVVSLFPLSAAAAVAAIMLISFLFRPSSTTADPFIAENINKDSLIIKTPEKLTLIQANKKAAKVTTVKSTIVTKENHAETSQSEFISSEKESIVIEPVEKITTPGNIILADLNIRNSLVASSTTFKLPVWDEGRSNIRKFIARTFREKILKEDHVSDAPLKGYELAEAGIEGLNKLLGWQMALDTNTGNDGDVESVHFNSRIIKFSAPVKKSEPSE